MDNQDSTQRFSDRVANYVRFRPDYPSALYEHLQSVCELSRESAIVEIGSGTGILSKIFLEQGHSLIGIEPNREMRLAAEDFLSDFERFRSLDGTAENMPVPDQSVDLLLAAQAFHWFDAKAFRSEALRVLKPTGRLALIWNAWSPDLSPFLEDYDRLLNQFGTDYKQVSRRWKVTDEGIEDFFGKENYSVNAFSNAQYFDFEGLLGRLLSSSYAPQQGEERFLAMKASLEKLFYKFQHKGRVKFDYRTRCFLGSLS